ncbi:DUF1801 domain-containing protein [Devosia sp.]|jgi:hypothetical protein|uniref:DUF1801 domain-containing protein n=1 Tax=Devosia sp. TaxID=1871048 RepID=UPI0037C17A6B
MTTTLQPADVAARYVGYPERTRDQLAELRSLVLKTAARTPGVGPLEEALKWGQPSFLTSESGSGTTIRIDAHASGGVAVYVNCKTNLLETYRTRYPELTYEGDRAIVLPPGELPAGVLGHCIALALTYHARKGR